MDTSAQCLEKADECDRQARAEAGAGRCRSEARPAEARLTIFLLAPLNQSRPKIDTLKFDSSRGLAEVKGWLPRLEGSTGRLPPSGDWQSQDAIRRHESPLYGDRKSSRLPK